jgi:hypothetical protein
MDNDASMEKPVQIVIMVMVGLWCTVMIALTIWDVLAHNG